MKHIALLLAALLVFSLTGCSSSEAAGTASDTDKAGAYEVIPPEDGRGDLIPASSDVASIPVLVGGGLPFTSMENLMNENYEDGTYTYEDMTQDGSVLVVDMAFQSLRTDETVEEYAEYAAQFAALVPARENPITSPASRMRTTPRIFPTRCTLSGTPQDRGRTSGNGWSTR